MEIFLWWLTAILLFLGIAGFSRIWGKTAFFCFGVGGVLNANYFNIGSYPLYLGGMIYGFDSALYSIFVFCALYFYMKYGKKEARDLNFAAVGAIVFLAIIQFIADLTLANTDGIVWGLFSYAVSALATFATVEGMMYVCELLRKKFDNAYLTVAVGCLVATLINSVLYFGIVAVAAGGFAENFGSQLLGSFAGKTICAGLSCLAYYLAERFSQNKKPKEEA